MEVMLYLIAVLISFSASHKIVNYFPQILSHEYVVFIDLGLSFSFLGLILFFLGDWIIC